MWHMIYFEKKQRMLFGAATAAIWGHSHLFVKRASGASFGGQSHSVLVRRGRCLDLPEKLKVPERLLNTGTTTVL